MTTKTKAISDLELWMTARQWDGLQVRVILRNGSTIAGRLTFSEAGKISRVDGQRLAARGKYSDEYDIIEIEANE